MMRSVTYPTVLDVDGIKTNTATLEAPVTYSDGDLNGAAPNTAGIYNPPRIMSVTTSVSAGSYNISDPIVFTGTDASGTAQTEEIFLTDADGGETINSIYAYRTISIDVPTQEDGEGSFKFGVDAALCPTRTTHIRASSVGNVKVTYLDGSIDTIPFLAGETQVIHAARIHSETTVTNLTVFF